MVIFKRVGLTLALLTALASLSYSGAATTYVFRQTIPGNPVPSCSEPGSKSFTTPGVYQVTVPAGCEISAVLAGAGGGNAEDADLGGGPGGLVSFNLVSSGSPLTVVVGTAGQIAYPSSEYSGGDGGGYSLVASGNAIWGVAGGGGGAAGNGGGSGLAYSEGGSGGNPGMNGEIAPVDYGSCQDEGTGATDLQAGTDGEMCPEVNTGVPTYVSVVPAGSAALSSTFSDDSGGIANSEGNNGNGGGGGGGGGYYGGGYGSDGGDYDEGGGGGGGSSYVISEATNVTETTGGGSPAETNGSVSLSW